MRAEDGVSRLMVNGRQVGVVESFEEDERGIYVRMVIEDPALIEKIQNAQTPAGGIGPTSRG